MPPCPVLLISAVWSPGMPVFMAWRWKIYINFLKKNLPETKNEEIPPFPDDFLTFAPSKIY